MCPLFHDEVCLNSYLEYLWLHLCLFLIFCLKNCHFEMHLLNGDYIFLYLVKVWIIVEDELLAFLREWKILTNIFMYSVQRCVSEKPYKKFPQSIVSSLNKKSLTENKPFSFLYISRWDVCKSPWNIMYIGKMILLLLTPSLTLL